IWVATNQCLVDHHSALASPNASVTNRGGTRVEATAINSATFGIVMSGTEARFRISWGHYELNCYMENIEGFLL
ncbi:hypothetical protein B0T10DRAFT_386396, partial [Thelonectria olida]